MLSSNLELVERRNKAREERARASSELTAELVRRSRERIAVSKELLKIEVPKVWPSGAPHCPQCKRSLTIAGDEN